MNDPDRIRVGCHYFPNYHVDPRNEKAHGPWWTEWQLVKHAGPRFPNHEQPKFLLWGYEDEAESEQEVACQKVCSVSKLWFE
jgi:hypothetical protein